ncbi:MAG: succinylglutamate desuccinylase/aspartoacylase family protein [Caldilineaceae bacterium]
MSTTSQNALTLGPLSATPGARQSGYVPVRAAGVNVELPIFLLNGAEPGPTLVVTAGIHGAEYPCVEAARRLARTVDVTTLREQLIIAPQANPLAFAARSIYITPPDGKNLNRQFPGDSQGAFSQALAYWLFHEIIRRGNVYIDLHGGDMIEALLPFSICAATGDGTLDGKAEALAHCFGLPYVVLPGGPASGISGATYMAAAQVGIPALLAEAGGQGLLDEASVQLLYTGLLRIMAHLGMSDAAVAPATSPPRFSHWSWLRAEANGLYYPGVQVGDAVREGQEVGHIDDIFGNRLQTAHAPQAGTVLFVVTSLAINTGDPLLAIAA